MSEILTARLTGIRLRANRKGDRWASAQLGNVEVLMFPEVYARGSDLLVEGEQVSMRGVIKWAPDGVAMIVEEILWTLEPSHD